MHVVYISHQYNSCVKLRNLVAHVVSSNDEIKKILKSNQISINVVICIVMRYPLEGQRCPHDRQNYSKITKVSVFRYFCMFTVLNFSILPITAAEIWRNKLKFSPSIFWRSFLKSLKFMFNSIIIAFVIPDFSFLSKTTSEYNQKKS